MDTKLICSYCECILHTGRQCYWHLRHEHGLDHAEAFSVTGDLLDEATRFERWKERMKAYPDGDFTTWINMPDPGEA